MHGPVDDEASIVVTSEDNVNDTDTQSRWLKAGITHVTENGDAAGSMIFKTFDTNGWTATWLSAPDAWKHWYLALETSAVDDPLVNVRSVDEPFVDGQRVLRR